MVYAICILAIGAPILVILSFILGYNIGCQTRKPILKKKSKKMSELDKRLKEIDEFQGW